MEDVSMSDVGYEDEMKFTGTGFLSGGAAGLMAEDTMTILPGLMQNQREKYGSLLFQKDDRGYYTCFFRNCGKQLQANFSRHIARHEMDNDEIDPLISTQIKALSFKANPTTVPVQICTHHHHEMWWNADPELPITDFYNRSSKCKKCYIRQQQESKKLRIKESGFIRPTSPSNPVPQTPPRPSMGSVMVVNPLSAPRGIPPPLHTPISNKTPFPSIPPTSPAFFNSYGTSGATLTATTPHVLSRPPREINRKHFNNVLMKRLRGVLNTVSEHTDAWPFNQPVDPVQLGLDDYLDIIKKPMDLRTVGEAMDAGKYSSPAQFAEDVRLVWSNAQTYNKIESEIYDFATALSALFEDLYKKVVSDTEAEAKAEAEMEQPSDICAYCGESAQPKLPAQSQPVRNPSLPTPPVSKVVAAPPNLPPAPTVTTSTPPAPTVITSTPPVSTQSVSSPPTSSVSPPPLSSATPAPTPINSAPSDTPTPAAVSNPTPALPAAVPDPTSALPAAAPASALPPITLPVSDPPVTFAPAPAPTTPAPSGASNTRATAPVTPSPVTAPSVRLTIPLIHCDGSCLRAFHPSCLGLSEVCAPWLCNECRNGKPVLHWDPARLEFFYYYYEAAVDADPDATADKTTFGKPSVLGMLPQEAKRKLRDEEDNHRLKEMYYDPLWCMWRCKSRDIVKQREERQRPLLKELEGNDEDDLLFIDKKQKVV